MNQHFKDLAFKRGLVDSKIVEVLATVYIAHIGWESDNEGWIVKTEKGKIIGLTTNHGGLCRWSTEEMVRTRKEAQDRLTSIEQAIAIFQKESTR